MSYFDVPERPLEPPEEKPIAHCDFCDGEIYEGDAVYRIDGELIHEDCLEEFARNYFSDRKEVMESEARARMHW